MQPAPLLEAVVRPAASLAWQHGASCCCGLASSLSIKRFLATHLVQHRCELLMGAGRLGSGAAAASAAAGCSFTASCHAYAAQLFVLLHSHRSRPCCNRHNALPFPAFLRKLACRADPCCSCRQLHEPGSVHCRLRLHQQGAGPAAQVGSCSSLQEKRIVCFLTVSMAGGEQAWPATDGVVLRLLNEWLQHKWALGALMLSWVSTITAGAHPNHFWQVPRHGSSLEWAGGCD